MASLQILVSSEALQEAISAYKSCKQSLSNAYLNMSNTVRVVDGFWDGEASEAFKGSFANMYKNIEQTEVAVGEAISQLEHADATYADGEAAVVQLGDAIDTGTPPAAFS